MFFQDSACRGWTWKEGYVDLVEVFEGLSQLPGGSGSSGQKAKGWALFHAFPSSRLVVVEPGREQHTAGASGGSEATGNAGLDLRVIWTGTW